MMDGRRDLPLEPKSWLSNPKGLRGKKKKEKREKCEPGETGLFATVDGGGFKATPLSFPALFEIQVLP